MTDWKEFIHSIACDKEQVRFFPPATEAELQNVEDTLGIPVPEALVELLRQTNGVSGELHYLEYTIGSCENIIEINQKVEKYYGDDEELPLPCKFFLFGIDGMGNYFGFLVENGIASSEEIRAYCPIANEFVFVSHNLKEWAIGAYAGENGPGLHY